MTRKSVCGKINLKKIKCGRAAEKENNMADNKNIKDELEYTEEEALFITLTDEDGKEIEFEVIGEAELDGTTYYAMMPSSAFTFSAGIIA